ncbi:hypothetical protein M9Y10_019167 [Tritrichomonas musculus]|uniref:DUF3447 domain-containing protein n=1 Tax=Tritrichomonas musculus TaxID=1915356 RepID=A0ABR2HIQ5_9EUKA
MEVSNYINEMKEFSEMLLSYFDIESDNNSGFLNLFDNIESLKIGESREELKNFFNLLINVANDHHRCADFFDRIEKILLYFVSNIKQTFSNLELFQIFQRNKRILLFLFTSNIITIDETILKYIDNFESRLYFYPEIKNFLNPQEKKTIENKLFKIIPKKNFDFKKVREIGENESLICQMIRNDAIDDFIDYVDQSNVSLSKVITPSIFETNSFLIGKMPTLIEYAAFFGSYQIFQFLKLSDIENLPSSLWLYSIHSNKAEIIHLLEESLVVPEDKSYIECYEEAVKCYHNEIASYILNNLMRKKPKNLDECIFRYYNYPLFPSDITEQHIVYYLCKYNYITLVKLLLNSKKVNLKSKTISKKKIFFIKFFF